MRASVSFSTVLVLFALTLGACGGSTADPSASEGAGRAIPTEIGDLQADCDRGVPGTCEALNGRIGDDLADDDRAQLLCAAWGDIQLSGGGGIGDAVDRIVELGGTSLPAEVTEALDEMAASSGDDLDGARDVMDEYFSDRC